MMKILIDDGMQLQVATGIGKYTKYLYESLKAHLDSNSIVELQSFESSLQSKLLRRASYLKYINSDLFLKKCEMFDIVHFTNFAIPFRRAKNTKYVVTVHDIASFLYPNTFSKKYAMYSRFVTNYSIKNADLVLTDSLSTKKEIESMWPLYSNKIKFIYPGFYTEFCLQDTSNKYELNILNKIKKEKFFLCVGTVERRKNLGVVIDAFLRLKEAGIGNDYKLVLAGKNGYGSDLFNIKKDKSPFGMDVIMTGYVSSNDLNKLYHDASAYIFPTIYEGFGSPQLECISHGLPLILSDIPTNREVSGNYGLFFNPNDIDELSKLMKKIVLGCFDKKDLHNKSKKIIEKFDWSELVLEFVDKYNELLN